MNPWLVVLACCGMYFALRPELYQFDGITYFFSGQAPLLKLNPHHLLWVPLERVFGWIYHALLHEGSLVFFQGIGIVFTALAVGVLYATLIRLKTDQGLSAAICLYVALAPPVWQLTPQNLPYPFFFLFTALLVDSFSRSPISRWPLSIAWISLVAGTMVHQSAVLFLPAGCLAIASTREEGSLRRAVVWGVTCGFTILLLYGVIGWNDGRHTLHDFMYWGVQFAHEIHPLRVVWPNSFIDSVMGFTRTVFYAEPLEEWLYPRWSWDVVSRFYAAAGMVLVLLGCTFLWFTRDRWRNDRPSQPLLVFGILSMATISLFALAWEPANQFFWVTNLFLLFPVGVLLAKGAPNWVKRVFIVSLVLLSGWNLNGNLNLDFAESANKPLDQAREIRRLLRPKDMLISLDRKMTQNVDYDLMFTSLEAMGREPGNAFLEDYVIPHLGSGSWQKDLAESIQDTLEEGAAVYVSNGLFDQDLIRSRSEVDHFAPYQLPVYDRIPWAQLPGEIHQFFSRYRLEKAFYLGNDTIWRVKPRVALRRF